METGSPLGEEAKQLPSHRLDVVLPPGNDERRDLVLHQMPVGDGFLILDAVHPFDHLVIKR